MLENGGREELRLLFASGEGPGAISAAAAVLRERVRDPDLVAAARTELVRSIASGARRGRLHAIAVAPIAADDAAGPILDALQQASKDDDAEIRVSALGRLAARDVPPEKRADVTARLEAIAGQKDDPELASRARELLAGAGDVRVQAWLEEDLRAGDPSVRLSAVGALAQLRRASRAAPILADPDASARTRGACALLLAARLGPPLR